MLLERGMIPQDTVSLVALSSCLAALTGALSRRPAAATTRAVRRSIVDDLLLDFRESVFSSARSVVHFLLLHLYVVSDENPRYKFKSQFEFVLESVSHCIGNIATDTVPSILGKQVLSKKDLLPKGHETKGSEFATPCD